MPVLLASHERSFYAKYGKRLLDIFLSLFALLVFSPLLYILVLAIIIDSPGLPFFVQKRFGQGVRPFRLIKFRSMKHVADSIKKEFEPGCTSRITRIGKILRKTKVDELPTLFNVLLGEMSIVGPRPEIEKYVQAYLEDFKEILKIRPGLSDFASIKYRDEETTLAGQADPENYYINVILPDKLHLAKHYAGCVSLNTDLKIIKTTLRAIIDK